MATIYNDSPNNRYIGGRCIPPGEFGEIPDELLPPDEESAGEAPPARSIPQLLEGLVRDIVPLLGAMSDEDLLEVDRLEHAGQQRKRVLSEVAEIKELRGLSGAPAQTESSGHADDSPPAETETGDGMGQAEPTG
jgi:hypothetical protein